MKLKIWSKIRESILQCVEALSILSLIMPKAEEDILIFYWNSV